jgi:ribonuclease HII
MPTLIEEERLLALGARRIAGIDEAGRGCWAGPVVAAAVVLSGAVMADPRLLAGVDDSKQLTVRERDAAAARVRRLAAGVGVGVVPAFLIDSFGIIAATRLAMDLALLDLPCAPDALLIDALALPEQRLPQRAIIRGDSLSLSIAAASVIAKTARDRLMRQLDARYPAYGFAQHKGYGTAAHSAAIARHGITPLHRRSFRPMWHLRMSDGAEHNEH